MDSSILGVREEDFTPKPLKVLKRNINNVASASLARSSSQNTLVPARKSSVFRRAQLSLIHQLSSKPTPSSTNGDGFPAVRKQRQHDRLSAFAIATRKVSPRYTELAVDSHSEQPTSRHRPIAIRGTRPHQNMPGANRSQSTSAVSTTDLSNSTNQNRRAELRRRTVTAGEIPSSQSPNGSTQSLALDRQPSSRRQLVSRVMNSFSSKSQTYHSKIADGDELTVDSPYEKESSLEISHDNIRQSGSSTYSRSFSEMLASFPAPPSNGLAPSALEKDAFEILSTGKITCQELSEPQNTLSLTAEVELTPEFHHINFENEESMFVALDIRGTIPAVSALPDIGSPTAALDVVIIIDNSLHTSPTSLMASCETTRFLASTLDDETDRMAIIQTSVPGENISEPNVLTPLCNIKPRKLKSILDQITTSGSESCDSRAADSLHTAQQILLGHRTDFQHSERSSRLTYGHIFLFTSYIDDSLEKFVLNNKITLHLVCANVLPQRIEQWPQINGWKIRSLTGKEPQTGVCKRRDDDLDDLEQDLIKVVHHARSGQRLGVLSGVVVDFAAGPDMTIEEVLGRRYFECLQSGEVRSVIVKVKCKRPKATYALLNGNVPGLNEVDLFGELEMMLNEFAATPALQAEVRYNHPLLPEDVTCSVTKVCDVRRIMTALGDLDIMRKPTSVLESVERMNVHRRLAFHYFTQLSPPAAMSALERMIGTGNGRMACPEYVALLMKEQQYQKRIAERELSLATSQCEIENPRSKDGGPLVIENPLDAMNMSGESSPIELISTGRFPDVQDGKMDAARTISNGMRKGWLALGDKTLNGASGHEDGQAKELKHTAPRNKRRVETAALRSLASSAKSSPGFIAPW